jgi:hypothetical protein
MGPPFGALKTNSEPSSGRAYLRWAPFRGIHDEVGPLLSMDPRAQDAIESGKAALRSHFRERAAERRQETIADLKDKGPYRYEGEPEGAVARAEREVFDIILVEVADSIPKDGSAAKLTVNLMKESLERDPVSLNRVLRSVVDLSDDQLQELEELLEQTTLGSIIASARTVVDRLDFVAALELLVYDPESARQLKERSQLHRIIANETWVFGEEFSKVVDDESLTKVLKAHIASLGRSELAPAVDDEVLRADGSRGIVDLMLSRAVPQARNRREHLVIELKRPSVSVGMDELNQVYRYAHAVAADPRFADADVSWEFIVVSGKLTEEAQAAVQQRDRPIGVYLTGEKFTIWAHTWGQIIDGANHRMKFMRERLDATVNEGTALEYLRRKHGDYLPATLADR